MNESSELHSKFHRGDKVSWHTHGTTTHGTVQDRLDSDTQAAGRTVRADPEHPQYLVRGDKSGRDAVHTPQALQKISRHGRSRDDGSSQESPREESR